MTYISENLMDNVWRKVGSKEPGQIPAMQKRHRKDQKALMKFAYEHLLELPQDAACVGLYVFHVVVEAFSKLTPRPPAVRRPAIDRAWGLPATVLAKETLAAEPYAAQYLEDALTEEDEVILTDSERALCERVVQAAILSLHGACGNRP